MRVRANILNGFTGTPIDKNGGVLTLPLLLVSGNPSNPLEAVSKQYVDGKVTSITASQITGTFLPARMPPLTGTDVSSSGGGVISLSNTGVVPGSYCKVTVDSKGRIIAGYALTAADIPVFSWSKITTGKPTTLAGYGITDGMSITGATLVGSLFINPTPTQGNQAANKDYVTARVASVIGTGDYIYKIGDVVARSTTTAQSGYFRCNGALVSITAYSSLFAAIGHITGVNPGGNNFYLPDLTTEEKAGLYWFIKAT
jgi:hypothetical protein